MSALFIVLLGCLGFATEAEPSCYDASGHIENGQVVCRHSGSGVTKFLCKIDCAPGYKKSPNMFEIACTQNDKGVGQWSYPIDTARCNAPTSCEPLDRNSSPENGRASCRMESADTISCIRRCELPFKTPEPEFVKEHCGPDTHFMWSHVLRHNTTKMPACELLSECPALAEEPANGHNECQEETWAKTRICRLKCDLGYTPEDSTKSTLFCGPTTAFQWSQEFTHRQTACKKAPITVEVDVVKECSPPSDQSLEDMVLDFLIELETPGSDGVKRWEFVDWQAECINEEEKIQKIYINFKDICIQGICKDICAALSTDDGLGDNCFKVCDQIQLVSTTDMLLQMQNVTLRHIGNTLLSRHLERRPEYRSMRVSVHSGRRYYGSEFCRI